MDLNEVLNRALDALHRKSVEPPLDDIDRALEIAPHEYRLWHIKGLIHRQQDQRELAIPALRRAVELAPSEPLVAHGYARTLLEAGQPSVDPFARALKLAPGDPGVITGLATALVAEGRLEEAIAGVELVVKRSPLWLAGHRLLSELRWASGQREDFTSSFDAAISAHPNSLDLRCELMSALVDAEFYDEVAREAKKARTFLGSHSAILAFDAAARSEMGETEAADLLFAKLGNRREPNMDVRFLRHLFRCGRVERALPIIDARLGTSDEHLFWPSASIAWRMLNDPRYEWLEGDDRLVGTFDILDHLPSFDKLIPLLRKLHTLPGQMLAQSVRGGTQTDGNLFHRIEPEIVELRETLRKVVTEHIANLPAFDSAHPAARRPVRVDFSGSWSVRLKHGGRHANHVHPMGWLSSALYIALPRELGGEDSAGWLILGEPDARLGLDLPPRRMIEPKPGRLVLFPSWMWHGTMPFSAGERLTVAFDVQPPI